MRVQVGEDEDAVAVSVGDSVVITLSENATTGYQWGVDSASDEVLVESGEFLPPDAAAPGAAGRRVVVVRAARAGTATVELSLKRPWEASATQRRSVAIAIHDPAG